MQIFEMIPFGTMPLAAAAAVVLFIVWISFAEAKRAGPRTGPKRF